MHAILEKLFHSHKIKPTKAVIKAFIEKFGHSKNIEWHSDSGNFEAIFYLDDVEHIALFARDGRIIEIKRNLRLSDASPQVALQAQGIGEMMNLIEIERSEGIFYEVIARDAHLDRYYLFVTGEGEILDKEKL